MVVTSQPMGFRFRKSIKLFPGLRLNLSKSGVSMSVGAPGATLNLSQRGARTTLGIPGTGVSYSSRLSTPSSPAATRAAPKRLDQSTATAAGATHQASSGAAFPNSSGPRSAQQLSADYRALAEVEANQRAQTKIERIESDLSVMLDSWRHMPHVPSAQDYQGALQPRPFVPTQAASEEQWARHEEQRIVWLRRLLAGDVEAIHEAVMSSLQDIDFPFDTRAAVGLHDGASAFLALDLPEIEDVIPELRFRILKNGSLKSSKRKADERNLAYARLVAGLAILMAAVSFEAAPTLGSVAVAARTQRKRRGSAEVEDQYVYETRISRALFAHGQVFAGDPLELLSSPVTRLAWGGKHTLKKISEPEWAGDLLGA